MRTIVKQVPSSIFLCALCGTLGIASAVNCHHCELKPQRSNRGLRRGTQSAPGPKHFHQRFFRFAEALITFSRVARSMSAKRLMYKQPFRVLCLPSFDNNLGSRPPPKPIYRGRFCLRGENPITGQSASLPLAYLIFLMPKPAILLPHMTPLLFVAASISFAIAEQSARVCALGRLLIKSATLCFVGFVFASAISWAPYS